MCVFSQVVQRVVFLHEDLVKLPTFPRKALEAELDLFEKGDIGKVRKVEKLVFFWEWILKVRKEKSGEGLGILGR